MNVEEIIKEYLKENKYDGLVSVHLECECELGDIAPCGDMRLDCNAGYNAPDDYNYKQGYNVEEIMIEYLKKNKYDGLVANDPICGCLLGDLAPCDEMKTDCTPGYDTSCEVVGCDDTINCIGFHVTETGNK